MMRIFFSIFILLFSFTHVFSQYNIRFVVNDNSGSPQDSICIAGTFNHWDPTPGSQNQMKPDGAQTHSITLNLPAGNTQYKYTRGSWSSVEQNANGSDIENRSVTIHGDTVIQDTVRAWRDLVLGEIFKSLAVATTDSARLDLMSGIIDIYAFSTDHLRPDSSLYFSQQSILIFDKIKSGMDNASWLKSNYALQLMSVRNSLASLLHTRGNYPKALELRLDNLSLAEEQGNILYQCYAIWNIITEYASMRDYPHVLTYGKLLDSLHRTFHDGKDPIDGFSQDANAFISTAYNEMGNLDSALYYAQKVHSDTTNINGTIQELTKLNQLGDIYRKKGDEQMALHYFRLSILRSYKQHYPLLASQAQQGMARIFQNRGKLDSALIYARRAMFAIQDEADYVQAAGENINDRFAEISPFLAELYKANHQPDSAYKYLKWSVDLKDSLFDIAKVREFQNLTFNEGFRKQQQEQQAKILQEQYQSKIKFYGLATGLTILLAFALILFRNNGRERKANQLLARQKLEVQNTLSELKSAQAQLIQSEKMASTG